MPKFGDDFKPARVGLGEPRSLSTEELELVDFLLREPQGNVALRRQAATARVEATCSCGCASVWLTVDEAEPVAALNDGQDYGRISAGYADGSLEVNLHVGLGRLIELEIWTDGFGERVRVDTSRLTYNE